MTDSERLLHKHSYSFVELGARQRARSLLDSGSFRELLDPFARVMSPWLERQGVVPQADDGVVIAKGSIDGLPVVIAAIEGAFQGGSLGEVGGAKIAGALELAAEDNRKGIPTRAVLLLETGGVRLQEANLGLAAIADIHAAIVDLRRYQPVIGVVAGSVGCFGGMSIAAALCSYLVLTREARLGLNGPQVIEQEAGLEEYDSRDRPFIWSLTGGEPGVNSASPAAWWTAMSAMTWRRFDNRSPPCWRSACPRRSAAGKRTGICNGWPNWMPRRRSIRPRYVTFSKESAHECLFPARFALVPGLGWRCGRGRRAAGFTQGGRYRAG